MIQIARKTQVNQRETEIPRMKAISTGDNGGLTGYTVVWHFVLNQIEPKGFDQPLTINVTSA